MRVAVIGASGRTGRATVKHALAAGLDVVSVVRSPSSAPQGTTVAQADARDHEALAAGVKGADAVVSCIGHVASDQDPAVLQARIDAMPHPAVIERPQGRAVIACRNCGELM